MIGYRAYLVIFLAICWGCTYSPIKLLFNDISKEKTVKKTSKSIKSDNTKATIFPYCKEVDKWFEYYSWQKGKCANIPWKYVRKTSKKKYPLVWTIYGDEQSINLKNINTTIILCTVHGDEITPAKFCYDIIAELDKLKVKDNNFFDNKIVVVAPIVNPEGFFKKNPTRVNGNGIDLNRNFPTADFKKDAIFLWKNRYRKDPRRFPGKYAMSEQEVIFQVNLIKRYKPDKIVSVHAPLTMLDYDGPSSWSKGDVVGVKANQLLIQMSKRASRYKVKNYPFFPGSLGNYAGNERHIPTYTLELPSSDYKKSDLYWKRFKSAIIYAISHSIKGGIIALKKEN